MYFLSFNPCFSGTTTYTRDPASPTPSGHRVSILVFLEPPLILPPRLTDESVVSEFQSLFFWNHHLYQPCLSRKKRCCKSFNPCFSGTTTYTPSFTDLSSKASSFNPCFSGTTTYTQAGRSQAGGVWVCFNPCFSGTTTYTSPIKPYFVWSLWFQSLFFWNHHLYLIFEPELSKNFPCFNPCFSGTTTYTACYHFMEAGAKLFQSLFFWNHHLYLAGSAGAGGG